MRQGLCGFDCAGLLVSAWLVEAKSVAATTPNVNAIRMITPIFPWAD